MEFLPWLSNIDILQCQEDWQLSKTANFQNVTINKSITKENTLHFNTVPHKRLLKKLSAYGFKGDLLAWITSFLVGRYQSVRVNNQQSESGEVKSKIPKDSVLRPLLFIIYINDLPDGVLSNLFLFTDDTKVPRCIRNLVDAL